MSILVCLLCICWSVCLSVGLPAWLSACLLVCLSAGLPVCWSACLAFCLSVGLPVCWCAGLPVCWSACMLVCLLSGLLVCLTFGLPVRWSGSLPVCWSACLLACLSACSVGLPVRWLVCCMMNGWYYADWMLLIIQLAANVERWIRAGWRCYHSAGVSPMSRCGLARWFDPRSLAHVYAPRKLFKLNLLVPTRLEVFVETWSFPANSKSVLFL